MTHNPNIHRRRTIRLKEYDYSQPGAYFVTICTYNRECLFGNIIDSKMQMNPYGDIVYQEWVKTPLIRSNVKMDEFVVMPNHIHGIIMIKTDGLQDDNVGAHSCAPLHRKPKSLGSFIAGFKSVVTKQINDIHKMPIYPVWQRNYYEHIIRDETELTRIREYIHNNSMNWKRDDYYVGDKNKA